MKKIEKPNMVELYNELSDKIKINKDDNLLELDMCDIFMWANKVAYECVCYWQDSKFFNELNALEAQGVKVNSKNIKTMKEITTPEEFTLSMNGCENIEQLEKLFCKGSLIWKNEKIGCKIECK